MKEISLKKSLLMLVALIVFGTCSVVEENMAYVFAESVADKVLVDGDGHSVYFSDGFNLWKKVSESKEQHYASLAEVTSTTTAFYYDVTYEASESDVNAVAIVTNDNELIVVVDGDKVTISSASGLEKDTYTMRDLNEGEWLDFFVKTELDENSTLLYSDGIVHDEDLFAEFEKLVRGKSYKEPTKVAPFSFTIDKNNGRLMKYKHFRLLMFPHYYDLPLERVIKQDGFPESPYEELRSVSYYVEYHISGSEWKRVLFDYIVDSDEMINIYKGIIW